MPTESLLVKYSSARAYKTVSNDQGSVINAFGDLLSKVHWTKTAISAQAVITFPLTVPIVDGGTHLPHTLRGCGFSTFVVVGGQGYSLFDAGREDPAPGIPCILVGCGTSGNQTLTNLCNAINASSNWTATFVDHGAAPGYTLTLTANIPGPDFNYADNQVDGRWGSITVTDGGGFDFSTTQAESPFSVKIQSFLGSYNQEIRFSFTANGGHVQFSLDTDVGGQRDASFPIGSYTIAANPHQFVITNSQKHELTLTSLFACSPHLLAPVGYGMFVVGPGMLNTMTFYAMYTSATAVDEPLTVARDTGAWPRFLNFRSAGTTPLSTPNGKAVFTTGYISFGKSALDLGALIGIVWDCVICSDVVSSIDPSDISGVILSGVKFVAIGWQSGISGYTRSTFLMAIPDTKATDPKTGLCNVFGNGVTRVSGNAFTALDEGRVITIDGQSATILSVTDGDHLTLTQPLAIIAGGSYVIAY